MWIRDQDGSRMLRSEEVAYFDLDDMTDNGIRERDDGLWRIIAVLRGSGTRVALGEPHELEITQAMQLALFDELRSGLEDMIDLDRVAEWVQKPRDTAAPR